MSSRSTGRPPATPVRADPHGVARPRGASLTLSTCNPRPGTPTRCHRWYDDDVSIACLLHDVLEDIIRDRLGDSALAAELQEALQKLQR